MANIYASQPGTVAIIASGNSLPGRVLLQDKDNAEIIKSQRVIVTNLNYQQATHTQFQQTLLNAIYLYSFGDRLGNIVLEGIGFAQACPVNQGSPSGVEDVLEYYRKYKVSNDHQPVKILIGTQPITGFLVAANIATMSTEHMTYRWTYTIASLPRSVDKP